MSEFRVNSITNQDGSAGPQVCGVSTFSGKSGVQIPSGSSEFRRQDGVGRGRGLIGGSYPNSPYKHLDFIEIATIGNSQDFGELANQHGWCACFGSNTRAVWAGGYTNPTSYIADISAVTVASEGDSFDFGDMRQARKQNGGASHRTRGLSFGGLVSPGYTFEEIDFITIASGGMDQDFGDTILKRRGGKALASPTRAVHQTGGADTQASPYYDVTNVIEFVTIQSKGNGQDFGDTSYQNGFAGHAGANETRGILAGYYVQPANYNTIEFLTIATTGNTQDFGDLTSGRHGGGMMTSKTRGVMTGSWPGAASNIIDFITIATAGDATDFGDLTYTTYYTDCISDSHGGLA